MKENNCLKTRGKFQSSKVKTRGIWPEKFLYNISLNKKIKPCNKSDERVNQILKLLGRHFLKYFLTEFVVCAQTTEEQYKWSANIA